MYDLLGPLVMIGIFFSKNLMSVHDPAKFQQYRVIFAKSAADTKNRMFFRDCALFMADTVQHGGKMRMLASFFFSQAEYLSCRLLNLPCRGWTAFQKSLLHVEGTVFRIQISIFFIR